MSEHCREETCECDVGRWIVALLAHCFGSIKAQLVRNARRRSNERTNERTNETTSRKTTEERRLYVPKQLNANDPQRVPAEERFSNTLCRDPRFPLLIYNRESGTILPRRYNADSRTGSNRCGQVKINGTRFVTATTTATKDVSRYQIRSTSARTQPLSRL